MLNSQRAWFRLTSSVLVVLMTVLPQGAVFAQAERQREAAKKLLIDPLQLTDPKAYAAQQLAQAQQRRAAAGEELRRYTHADAQEARAKEARQAAEKVKSATPDAALRRELARQRSVKLPEAKRRERLVKVSPALAKAFKAAETRRLKKPAPQHKPRPPAHAPVQFPAAVFHEGKQSGQWLREDRRALYASVVGQGAYVEQPDGRLVSVEDVVEGAPPVPLRLASLMSDVWPGMSFLGALADPSPADLAETPETRRTPEMQSLIQSLGGSPLALYNYVHARIANELYFGSKKGSAGTFIQGAGNDFDQAALLIALLRGAGVPARYEYAVVRLSLDQANALTGHADADGAASLLARSGFEGVGVGVAGQSVLMRRAFVRAYVPYGDYRGTGPGGERLWVRLDPGLKRVQHVQGVNLKGLVHFDFEAYLAALNPATPREVFERQLLQTAKAQNLCNTLDDALPKANIQQAELGLLPADHPAKVESSILVFARPPDVYRFGVTFEIDGVTKSFELSELQGRRVSLRYPGATAADQTAIQNAGGITHVQPSQVNVAPSLRVDGAEVQRFPSLNPGTAQDLTVTITRPTQAPVSASHRPIAGAVYALMVTAGAAPASQLRTLQQAVPALTGDDRAEAESQLALWLYAHHDEGDSRRMFALQRYTAIEDVLEGMAGRELSVEEIFGVPVSLSYSYYTVDIARDSLTPLSIDAQEPVNTELMKLAGHNGSFLENKVWEEVFGTPAVSAVRIVQQAGSQGVPVYRLTPDNNDLSVLEQYSQKTLDGVSGALASNMTVTIPKHPLNFQQYVNEEAYIMIDPATGAGGYIIGQTLNGGASTGPGGIPGLPDCAPCSRPDQTTNSIVNMADGTMRESWTDLTLPAVGWPITWSRTYASRAGGMTELGYGWMHSYGVQLRSEPDGSLTYVTGDWSHVRFTPSGGAFTSAPGWHLTLTTLADGHRIRTKDGMLYDFNNSGQLRSIQEPGGNRVDLVYSNGLLSEVHDSSGAVALRFEHAGNKISKVIDRANRSVAYTYVADDLTGAADVLGAAEGYGYDGAHHLTSRTDKRGKVWTSIYDEYGRWVGSVDPLGQEMAAYYDEVNRRTAFVDRTGAPWIHEYNAAGNPTADVDPLGNRVERTWDADSNLRVEKDARGGTTTRDYDAQGNMLRRQDPDGRVTTYTYEATFNRVTSQASTGLPTVTNTFDSVGRLVTRTDGLGATSYAYDARGQLTTGTQPGNAITRFTYDTLGNLKAITDPAGGVSQLGFDGAGHLTSITDPKNGVRTMEVDAAGHVTAMLDALQGRTEFTYDEAGNRLSAKDPAGHVTQSTYDDTGRVRTTTDALGGVSRKDYDPEGRLKLEVDARGARTEMRYDVAGRLASISAADGSSTQYGYCADVATSCSGGRCSASGGGEPCATVDALGHLTKKEFDVAGRVTKVTDPLGRETVQAYDAAGRLQSSAGPNQAPTTYGYWSHGLLAQVTTPVLTVTYGYDARGNRTEANAAGQPTKYTYDAANRLLSETNPLGQTTSFTYDAAGNRATRTDGNGKVTTYTYDANRRLSRVTFQDGSAYAYDYDSRGNRTHEKSPTHERTFAYDVLNRLQTVNDLTLGKTLTYAYDANGNRQSLAEGSLRYTYAYDALNRLRQVADSAGLATTFEYNAAGRRTSVMRPNGVRTTYGYDDAGQVLSVIHAKDGAVLAGFTYQYDARGNRVSRGREDGTSEVYAYDAADRLVRVDYGSTRTVTYDLDAQGNRLALGNGSGSTESSTYNAFNQLTQSTKAGVATAFAYDRNGNLLSEMTGQGVKSYTWDLNNRLHRVALGGPDNSFEYDADGLRTKKVEGGVETSFLLDGSNVLEEIGSTGGTQRSYVSAPQSVDEIISFSEGRQTHYPLTDALGSIVAIADGTGAVERVNSYDVYGARMSTSGTGPALVFGFTGREHDDDGLIYMRMREYRPDLGRFVSPDPYTFALARSGAVSAEPGIRRIAAGLPYREAATGRYGYANDNPGTYTDPTGLFVLYTGLTGTAGAGVGSNVAFGIAAGFEGGLSSTLALTAGWAVQLMPSAMLNISIGVEAGFYWGLDTACDYAGPFLSLAADAGSYGFTVVWNITPSYLRTFAATRAVGDLSMALGYPVGVSVGLTFPIGMPPTGLTLYVTLSFLFQTVGCSCGG